MCVYGIQVKCSQPISNVLVGEKSHPQTSERRRSRAEGIPEAVRGDHCRDSTTAHVHKPTGA